MQNKNKKVLVLGYFGYKTNQLDGQTVKTRNIYKLINNKKIENLNLRKFDTENLQISKHNYFRLIKEVLRAKLIIYIPGINNLQNFFLPLYFISKILKKEIHFVVVGGWLSDFLMKRTIYRYCFSKIEGIYPQTNILTKDLKTIHGLENVFQLPNYRMHDFIPIKQESSSGISLVFMARIHPKKGLDTIFKLAELIKDENINIDVFGPFHEPYKEKFLIREKSTPNLTYRGIIQPDEIYTTLTAYDVLLFPTEYYNEGFPGSVLDAFIAEIPVVASEWRYANEFIDNGLNGIIVPFKDQQAFLNGVIKLIQNPLKINQMKIEVAKKKKEFSAEKAWSVISNYILKTNY